MISERHVLDAVYDSRVSTGQGLLQRLFAFWFDAFVYNQIWEDPRVDLAALALDSNSRVLTISSGGCNVLNYLVEGPQSITAVDLNRYHINLLDLKLAAVRHLPDHRSFFQFFGMGLHPDNIENYRRYIAPNLDDDTLEFWHGNGITGHLLHGERIEYFTRGGLFERSRNGYFLRFFHGVAHLLGLHPERLLEARSLDEQQELFDRHIAPFFDSAIVRAIGRLPVTTFGLGIPPQQLDELKRDLAGERSLIDIYRERVHRLACKFPIADNYFAWQAFARRYDIDQGSAIPEYLKARHFALLKENIHRIATSTGSITDQIKRQPRGTFNRFVLLDAQDWMNAATMSELWAAIAEKSEPGSRIIFRSAANGSPLERNLPPVLLERFSYEADVSTMLFDQDRASIYGGFHLYILKK